MTPHAVPDLRHTPHMPPLHLLTQRMSHQQLAPMITSERVRAWTSSIAPDSDTVRLCRVLTHGYCQCRRIVCGGQKTCRAPIQSALILFLVQFTQFSQSTTGHMQRMEQ